MNNKKKKNHKMFFKEEDVTKLLNCPRCKQRYVDPKIIVPCSNVLCYNCVQHLSENDSFTCNFCNCKHRIPQGGFKPSAHIEMLLKLKPDDVYRNDTVEEFKRKLNKLTALTQNLDRERKSLESNLIDHCSSLKSKIELSSQKKIEEINQTRIKYLKHVEKYQRECIENLSNNKYYLENQENAFKNYTDACKKHLKEFKIDEQVVRKENNNIDEKIKEIETLMSNLKFIQFNGKLVDFVADDNKISPELIGKFNQTELEGKTDKE